MLLYLYIIILYLSLLSSYKYFIKKNRFCLFFIQIPIFNIQKNNKKIKNEYSYQIHSYIRINLFSLYD